MSDPTTDSLSPEASLQKALEEMELSLNALCERRKEDPQYRDTLERLGILLPSVRRDLHLCRRAILAAGRLQAGSPDFRKEARQSLRAFLADPLSWCPDEATLTELSRTSEEPARDIRRCADSLRALRVAAMRMFPSGQEQSEDTSRTLGIPPTRLSLLEPVEAGFESTSSSISGSIGDTADAIDATKTVNDTTGSAVTATVGLPPVAASLEDGLPSLPIQAIPRPDDDVVPVGKDPADLFRPLEDDVQFRAVAPATLERGMWFPLKVMMYEGDDWERADREAAKVAKETAEDSSSLIQLQRGREVSIQLQSADVEFEEDTRTMRWNGRFSACTFEGLVPESFAGRQVRIRGRVRQGLTVLTDLRLILKVEGTPTTAPAPEETQTVPLELCALRSAFLSYASQDRARVAACIRGILLVRPDLDIFFDVVSLRRGEHYEERIFREIDRRDLFYLFWSVAASRSEWVGRELSFALDHLGKERVEPVPLDPPDRCPPPAALNDRHFNDWLLRYESSSNSQPLATPTFFWLQTESGVSVFVPAEGGCLGRKGLGRELFAGDRNVELWHAQAVLLDGRVHIQDLESTSGVLLNGTRLSPYRLTPVEPGDQLTLGSTTFTLRTL